MKIKFIAAACAALCSAGAFAAVLSPASTTVAPANIVYIGGASAQKNALDAVLRTQPTVFAIPADVVKIAGPNGSVGYLGTSNSALGSVPFLVIYNSTNGSAAGLNQLLSTAATPTEAEANVLALSATCTAPTGAAGTWAASCSTSAVREIDMALSDVFASEFGSSGSLGSGAGYLTLSGIKSPIAAKSTGLEGFGVITNAALYNALLAQNVTEGILPASCSSATAPSASTGVCQPSLRSRDYAALVTKGSGWDSQVISGVAGVNTTVYRRDELSGTQAASNIFFLNNVCGQLGFGGKLTPARASDSVAGVLSFVEAASTGAVETGVAGATGYGLGVVSTGEKDHADVATNNYWYVKLDGQSPNYLPNGTLDTTHKVNMLNGDYTFATEMAAYVRNTVAGKAAIVAAAVASDMQDSTKNPGGLNGIGYLDAPLSWPDGVQSKFSRGGNNCAPLH